MSEKLTKATAVAYRVFETAADPEEKVTVLVGKPEQFGENEWRCPYRIVGSGKDLNLQIAALDSVQALQLVWAVIDSAITGADLSLLWEGNRDLGLI